MTKTNRIAALAVALALTGATTAPVIAFAQAAAPAAPATTPATDAAAAAAAPAAAAPAAAAPTGAPAAAAPAAAPGTPDASAAPAAAPAPDANAPVDQGNGTEEVSNPYGLAALWKTGGLVSHAVLILLVIMSLGTWYIMITKFIEQALLFSAGKAAAKNFWKTASVRDGIKALKPSSPFRFIAESGVSASEHHEGALTDSIDLHTWVTMSVQRAQDTIRSRLQGGLAFLATVGSTAPFVGLFGTVWGIYQALTAIGIAGQASIDKVAGPVGEALIMTAIGLFTAVPAVLGYNFLVSRNKAALEQVRNFSSDVHSILLSGSRMQVGAGSSSKAA